MPKPPRCHRMLRIFSLLLAAAASPVAARELPELDVRAALAADRALPAEASSPRFVRPGREVQADGRYGLPTFVWASGRPVPPGARSPDAAARAYLREYAPLYRLSAADVLAASVAGVHDTGRGAVIVQFRAEIDGVEVHGERLSVAMDRSLRLVSLSGFLAGADTHAPRARAAGFRLAARAAVAAAMADLGLDAAGADALRSAGPAPGGYERFEHEPGPGARERLTRPARARRVYLHLPEGLEPGYYVEVEPGRPESTDAEGYAYVVSATDGRVLVRRNLVVADSFTYRVWADTDGERQPLVGPHEHFSPHPAGVPNGSSPAFIPPVLVSLQNGPISTNDPWLAAAATQTRGNNVDAYADLSAPDGFSAGDLRAATTSLRTFERTYDTSLAPDASDVQRMAAVTQLFYVNNWLHDWYYDAGFDEAAGNAQHDNYGRGGVGGDRLLAEAQDFSSNNNANMSTPADGSSPRMQMFIFTPISTHDLTLAPGGTLMNNVASFGDQAYDVTAPVVAVDDGVDQGSDGCTAFGGVTGAIALVDRGICSSAQKVKNAQDAGAVGVIVANDVFGFPPPLPDQQPPLAPSIPAMSITQEDGAALRAALQSRASISATLFRQAQPDRDGTIDNQIVAHEWGHYLSNRLIPLGNNQGRGMGEGWSDFNAMLMTVKESDDYDGVYTMAGYSTNPFSLDSFYFGIRRYPYSTDLTKSPLQFRHIQNGMALPDTILFNPAHQDNAQVHNTGEVWAAMLMECYVGLLKDSPRLSFTEARLRMRDYLVASYKLTPPNPTFVEARDALLAAMQANDPEDMLVCAQAFAKRGLGSGAVAPDRNSEDHAGVVESFALAPDPAFEAASLSDTGSGCKDGLLDAGEVGALELTLSNRGFVDAEGLAATVASTHPDVTFPDGNAVGLSGTVAPYGTTSGSVNVALGAASGIQEIDLTLTYGDPEQLPAEDRTETLYFLANADLVASSSRDEGFESPVLPWSTPSAAGKAAWQRTRIGTLQHRMIGPNADHVADFSLVSPPIQVGDGNFTLGFRHRHSFETSDDTFWDGGVVELSTNGGASWADVGTLASPGYGGTITDEASNPLANRLAYVDKSAGYSEGLLDTVTLDFGMALQGQTVQFRFRIGTDEAVGDEGWQIDDLTLSGSASTPFTVLVPDGQNCLPTPTSTPQPTATPTATAQDAATATPTATVQEAPSPTATPTEPAVAAPVGRHPAGLSVVLALLAAIGLLGTRARRRLRS
jgi:large repetitive protein